MDSAQPQPAIVIVGADPEWAFGLQQRMRAALGWGYDILITFTAEQALAYVHRRSPLLLIAAPRLARKAHIMDTPALLRAVAEQAPATRLLLASAEPAPADGAARALGAEDTFAAACRLLQVAPQPAA